MAPAILFAERRALGGLRLAVGLGVSSRRGVDRVRRLRPARATARGRCHRGRPKRSLMVGAGFEPAKAEPTRLQPVPFDRSGIPPTDARILAAPAGRVSRSRAGLQARIVKEPVSAPTTREDRPVP